MIPEDAGFQQEKKPHYSRHKGAELVILIQEFITTKSEVYPLALWELITNASAAFQCLTRTRICLHIVPCSDLRDKL